MRWTDRLHVNDRMVHHACSSDEQLFDRQYPGTLCAIALISETISPRGVASIKSRSAERRIDKPL